jgi:hypothetical protein
MGYELIGTCFDEKCSTVPVGTKGEICGELFMKKIKLMLSL